MFGLGGRDVLGHGQVDELVLGFGLHHAGALLPDHHDVLGDVDVTVQAWGRQAKGGQRPPPPPLRGAESDDCDLDVPKVSMVSRIMSITTIVPVRPIPAL